MKLKPGAFVPELLRHIFRKPATVRYPFEKIPVPDDFRGTPVLSPDKCIVCRACVRDCPAFAIEILEISQEEKEYRMIIHNDRCIHCAQCAESCPTKAITLNKDFELATDSRIKLKTEYTYRRPKKTVQQSPEK
ncbi:MAG TPA: 4Fe-4S binding protein [Candidatus Ratteibacteria bacterium]|jgi:formate hydrogenlyase subunit 6/NADH:ubiquinone oxidoreductase subunit I|uniref:NAD(P)H-quinone oxidoreductase subunit I n=1 Tax=candidate division TA06 bacterium ADurb.Bin131 TaxID=1852827 RepID=A0A1V6C5R5_UNCT6|nr:MAG: NAD(P)H-quinone oxidoreductase subunit I [candidate division TA06 bacterium ADurb.Bin131]HOC03249.1 4Fe-4S binding protein [bacterium]HRS06935.1 4Fe-4S binding protein [Candidatus Ratteibacteria bacterium]HON06106.1 4Fe-4S binding protein [bacterium]HPC29147.1 4Fe-4S binding protein [bacterium]